MSNDQIPHLDPLASREEALHALDRLVELTGCGYSLERRFEALVRASGWPPFVCTIRQGRISYASPSLAVSGEGRIPAEATHRALEQLRTTAEILQGDITEE